MDVVAEDGLTLHVFQSEILPSVGRYHRLHVSLRQAATPSRFGSVDVRLVVAEDRMRRLSQERTEGDLVSHRPGHDEQAGLLAGERGDVGFEVGGRRVFLVHVVHQRSLCNGLQHRVAGSSDCVF